MNVLWCNGDWLDRGELPVSTQDRGLLHGMGLFETILAMYGRPIFAEQHLERFKQAAARLGWEVSVDGMVEAMTELLVKNQMNQERARIRLAVTAGKGSLSDLSLGSDALVWMHCAPADFPPEQMSVMTSKWKRNEHSPLMGLKCASYAENLLALEEGVRAGYDEVLFYNTSDVLCEGSMSNVFLVKNEKILTPDLSTGCLPGVTRAAVIEIAKELDVSLKECSLSREDLEKAEEVFMTSSTKGVVPVTRVDERQLHVGGVTSQLRVAWERRVG